MVLESEFEFAMSRCGKGSRVEIIVEILNEANKTRLMYRHNLNFGRFNHYLKKLLDAS